MRTARITGFATIHHGARIRFPFPLMPGWHLWLRMWAMADCREATRIIGVVPRSVRGAPRCVGGMTEAGTLGA